MEKKDSLGKMIILGIQHVFAMFGATVLVPMITGMNPSVALFCAGVGTLLFHFVTKRKVPAFLGSSFAFMAAIQAVAYKYSNNAELGSEAYIAALPYATGGIIAAGFLYVVLALLVKLFGAEKIRSFFPPIVTGPMVIIIGLMLAPTAISSIQSQVMVGGAGLPLWNNWVVALITILTIVIVTLFAKGFFKLVPILIGIVVGYIAALIFGMVDTSSMASARFFALPAFFLPKFDWEAIVMVAPLAIVTFVEHIGDMTANGAVTGNDFIKDPGLHRTLLGDGLATMLAGAIGGPANTTYSENTGVLAATKNYNPATLRIAACFAILISAIGKVGAFLQSIPGPVMGGVSVVLFGMIAAVGLRTLIENQVDFKQSRNLLIASIMLVMGLGGASLDFGSLSFSGVALAAVLGIVLNKVLPENIEKE
ncbi:purine/pyrimidine permease [Christensenellaceae bacterium OttesenSCG-928-L17]|nr:purine/pyrimidine permease [Christensenellaceae bacterium OttesenSCG-928-L17]